MSAKTPPTWIDSAACGVCSKSFSLLVWKHHCRNCGNAVCDDCSGARVALPQFGFNDAVRVCSRCNTSLSSSAAAAPVAKPKASAPAAAPSVAAKPSAKPVAKSKPSITNPIRKATTTARFKPTPQLEAALNAKLAAEPNGIEFKYQSDFDENGVLFWLSQFAPEAGPTGNASERGLVMVKFSSLSQWGDEAHDLLTRRFDPTTKKPLGAYCLTFDHLNSGFEIDFGPHRRFSPTAYTLLSCEKFSSKSMISWAFEGSNCLKTWYKLDEKFDEMKLCGKSTSGTFEVQDLKAKLGFRYLRWMQRDTNAMGLCQLVVGGCELYGRLFSVKDAKGEETLEGKFAAQVGNPMLVLDYLNEPPHPAFSDPALYNKSFFCTYYEKVFYKGNAMRLKLHPSINGAEDEVAIEGAVEAATQESSKEEIKTEAEEGAALSNSKSEEGQEEGAAAEETTPEENEIGSAAETNSVAASLPSPVSDRVGAPANSALYLEGTAEIMDPFFTRRATVRVKVRGVYALFSFKWDAGDEKDGVEDEFDGHQIFSSVSLVQFANLDQKKKGPILIEGHRVHCNYAFNQFRPYFFGVERDEAFFLQIEHRNRIVNGSMLAKEFVEQAAARLGRPPSSVAQICQMWQDKWLDTVKQLNECSEEEWASWNLPIPLFKEMQKMTDPGSNTVLVIDCCTCGECPLTGHVFISAQHFRKIQYQCPTCQAARRGNYQDFSPYDPVEDMLRVRFQAHLESALWAVNCALRKEQDAKGLARVVQILEFYVKQPSILTKSFIKNGLPKSQMPILEDTLRSVFQEDLKTRKEELGREVEQKKLEAAAAKSGKAPPKASAAAAANESKKPTLSQVGKKLANTVMTQLKEKAEQEAKEKGQEVAKKVGKVLLGVGKVVGKGLLGALFHVHL